MRRRRSAQFLPGAEHGAGADDDEDRRRVVVIDAGANLQQAARLMREHHVGAVVVTRGSGEAIHVAGVISDRDLAIEVLARGLDVAQVAAERPVQGPPHAVAETASLAEAVAAMQGAGVRRLLVHDAQGHLVGLLSLDDILPACVAPLAGLADALRKGREREVAERGAIAAPPRPALRVPAMGTTGWSGPNAAAWGGAPAQDCARAKRRHAQQAIIHSWSSAAALGE